MSNRFINTKEDSLSIYLKDVRKSETISVEEEIELAKRIETGDEKALNELVNANLRFVIKIAKDYQNQGVWGEVPPREYFEVMCAPFLILRAVFLPSYVLTFDQKGANFASYKGAKFALNLAKIASLGDNF